MSSRSTSSGSGSLLAGWERSSHAQGRFTSDTYRLGTGPGVMLMHESPGLTPEVIAFGRDLVHAGYTVVMPHLFGNAEQPPGRFEAVKVVARVCVRREFTLLATGRTTPVVAQPAIPVPIGRRRKADLNFSPTDLARVKDRVDAGCPVLPAVWG